MAESKSAALPLGYAPPVISTRRRGSLAGVCSAPTFRPPIPGLAYAFFLERRRQRGLPGRHPSRQVPLLVAGKHVTYVERCLKGFGRSSPAFDQGTAGEPGASDDEGCRRARDDRAAAHPNYPL